MSRAQTTASSSISYNEFMIRLHKGFTLAELLIVITIILILGLVLLVGINPLAQIFKGYDARRRADLNKIKIGLEAYYSDHECYPQFDRDSEGKITYVCDSDFLKPYIDKMPCDPNSHKPYNIYLVPENSVCPQQYSVYAQVYSFFDRNATKIEKCDSTIAVFSSGMNLGDINYGCSGTTICSEHFGCKDGYCQKLSGYEDPGCTTNYPCLRDCGGVDCAIPLNACM